MATTKVPKPLSTAVGKKIVMAATGLLLCVYLVAHLMGNLALLSGARQFNAYAHFLTSIPILPLIELGLLAIFLIHAYDGIQVVLENKHARPVDYQVKVWAKTKNDKSRKSVSSSTMIWSGLVIVVFVVLHVWHFKYGPDIPVQDISTATGVAASAPGSTPPEAQEHVRNLAWLVVTEFKKPWIMLLYVAAMFVLGLHLYHAVSSSFQSLGVSNKRVESWILIGGKAFTILIAGGFAMLPIWVFLTKPSAPAPPPDEVHVMLLPTTDQGGQLGTGR